MNLKSTGTAITFLCFCLSALLPSAAAHTSLDHKATWEATGYAFGEGMIFVAGVPITEYTIDNVCVAANVRAIDTICLQLRAVIPLLDSRIDNAEIIQWTYHEVHDEFCDGHSVFHYTDAAKGAVEGIRNRIHGAGSGVDAGHWNYLGITFTDDGSSTEPNGLPAAGSTGAVPWSGTADPSIFGTYPGVGLITMSWAGSGTGAGGSDWIQGTC